MNLYSELDSLSTDELLRKVGEQGYTALLLREYHTAVEQYFSDDGSIVRITDDAAFNEIYRSAIERKKALLQQNNCQNRNDSSVPGAIVKSNETAPAGSGSTVNIKADMGEVQPIIKYLGEKRGFMYLTATVKNNTVSHIFVDGKKMAEFTNIDEALKRYGQVLYEVWEWVLAIWT